MRRAAQIALGAVVALLILVGGTILILTRTSIGHERAKAIVLGLLRDKIKTELHIGRIEGDLTGKFALVDVSIADQPGKPFLSADRIVARLGIRSLFSKRIYISELAVINPVVRLAKGPDGVWNYSRIFVSGPQRTDTTRGFGDWIQLDNVEIQDGTLTVQQPWSPDQTLSPAARDSVVAAALGGEIRDRIERVGNGYQRTMDFSSINARSPQMVLANPDSNAITIQLTRLGMVAAPFRPPEVVVRDFHGGVRIAHDTLTVRNLALQLTSSRFTGSMTYLLTPGDVLLSLNGETIAFSDLRWLYPPLPDSGGGSAKIEVAVRPTGASEYAVRNAKLAIGDTHIDGDVGLDVGTSITRFRDTDLRITRLSTALVQAMAPKAKIPTPGVLTGRAEVNGPIDSLRVALDATFAPARHAPFHVVARGGVGLGTDFRAQALNVHTDGLPVDFLREFDSTLTVGGTLTADATVSGSSKTSLAGRFSVTHQESTAVSRVEGDGSIAPRGGFDTMQMNVGLRFTPVSMQLVQHFVPNTKLQGAVEGTGRVTGTPRNVTTHLELTLPTGTVTADGVYDRTQSTPVYTASLDMKNVDIQKVVPTVPATVLNGVVHVAGRGTSTETMNTRLRANLRDFSIDSTQFLDAVIVATARDARLLLDTMRVRATFGSATASGTLGLATKTDGTLNYRVDIETLAGLQRWISTGDTTSVAPRAAVRQRLTMLAAKADSVRRAQAPDTVNISKLAAQGDPWLRRRATGELAALQPVRRDSLAGTLHITGALRGQIQQFTARGKAVTSGVVWGGNEIGRGAVDFTYADVRTPNAVLTADAGFDSVRTAGFAFDSTHVKGKYRNDGSGDVELAIFPGDTAEYRLRADYALHPNEGELHVQALTLRMDSTTWASSRPSRISWKGHGLTIDSLDLRARQGGGHIFVNGTIPDVDRGSLAVDIDSLRVAPWLTLLQSDVPAKGMLTFKGRIEGTRLSPTLAGTLALRNAIYRGTAFPDFASTFNYDQRRLVMDGDLHHATGAPLARIRGTLPIDLSLGDSVQKRLLDTPITLDITGDSMPLAPLQNATEALTVLDGSARGSIGVRGTFDHPRFEGDLRVDLARLGFAANGVVFTNAVTRLRMSGDSLVIDSLTARSGGTIRGSGVVRLTTLTHPVLDVRVETKDARVLNNEQGELFADMKIRVSGPLDTLSVFGAATVTRGVVYLPDPEKLNLISTGDPAVLSVIDSTTAKALGATESPTLRNLNADVAITVARGTWARSREANVEVFGNIRVRRNPVTQELAISGALRTDQGDYTLYGHRFNVTRGSVRFTGDPTINPTLQVTGSYDVHQPGRAPFEIRVVVGGTMRRPNLALESDAQPTLSQSDLLSFLAFGKSSTSLLQFQGDGIQGSGQSGSSLAGNVAALASRQLSAVALGAMMDEAKTSLVSATRADVVNITPADLPAGLSLTGFGTILRGTEIEIGKYADRQTFIVGQFRPTLAIPGAAIERRYGKTFRVRASFETRYQPERPSLVTGLAPRTVGVVGTRMTWTFHW